MADPTPYTVSYSFAGFQANSPTTPLPGASLDNELAGAATAIASIISSLADIRRTDGALKNGIVTFDSFEAGLQLTLDPTNGELVAAAVATTAANAELTDIDRLAAAVSAAAAAASAVAAAASASTVNLALYLAKANNLAGLGSLSTSRTNLGLGSVATFDVGGGPDDIVQLNADSKIPAYDGSLLTGIDVLPVGAVVMVLAASAPTGTLKLNGALISRATYARLWAYAESGAVANLVTEANWSSSFSGSFSTGDLSTTFRLPDLRGEFPRGWDDSRGVDATRSLGTRQADSLKDHTHLYGAPNFPAGAAIAAGAGFTGGSTSTASGSPSTGAAAETRPRNIPLLFCIKY